MNRIPGSRQTLLRAGHARGLARKRGWKQNWIGEKESEKALTAAQSATLSRELKVEAKRLGLPLTVITSAKPSKQYKHFEKWLENGYAGEMGYMSREDRLARRRDPNLILPGSTAVVMVGMPYWPGESGFPAEHAVKTLNRRGKAPMNSAPEKGVEGEQDSGIVSCYAWGEDYHRVLGERLRALGQWVCDRAGGVGRYYVDTGAVFERDFAERAGMGFVGKNSLLISPTLGSGVFLGALFTTAALAVEDIDGAEGAEGRRGGGRAGCGKCTKCRVHCPTQAIVADRVVDARRCISYLTIELKGAIPLGLRRGVGARVYGCDICQQVCPWNRIDWDTGSSPLWGPAGKDVTTPRLTELLALDEKSFKSRFQGSAVHRIGAERLSRNAAVALGNVGGRAQLPALAHAAGHHKSEMVREHAAWAMQEISGRFPF